MAFPKEVAIKTGHLPDGLTLAFAIDQISFYRGFRSSPAHPVVHNPQEPPFDPGDSDEEEYPPRFKPLDWIGPETAKGFPDGVTEQKVRALLNWAERINKPSPAPSQFLKNAEDLGLNTEAVEFILGLLRFLYFQQVDRMATADDRRVGDGDKRAYRPVPDLLGLLRIGGFLLRQMPPDPMPDFQPVVLSHAVAFAVVTCLEHVMCHWCAQKAAEANDHQPTVDMWQAATGFLECLTLWMRQRIRKGDTSVSDVSSSLLQRNPLTA